MSLGDGGDRVFVRPGDAVGLLIWVPWEETVGTDMKMFDLKMFDLLVYRHENVD